MAALEHRHELRLLDQVRPESATIFAGVAERVSAPFKTTWPFVEAEVTDASALREACEGMDVVVHLAGEPLGNPDIGVSTFRTNALGTYVAIHAAHEAGVQRFFCASSINAFGTFYWRLSGNPVPYETMPLDESFPPIPEDPYSLSKLVNEETCAAFTRAYSMTTAAFRFAAVFSAERYDSYRRELAPTMAWSDDLYQWVHIDDVVSGLTRALEAAVLPRFGVYTLSAGDTRCPEPTMELLNRFRPDLAARITSKLDGRAPLLSIAKARNAFGYAPSIRMVEPEV